MFACFDSSLPKARARWHIMHQTLDFVSFKFNLLIKILFQFVLRKWAATGGEVEGNRTWHLTKLTRSQKTSKLSFVSLKPSKYHHHLCPENVTVALTL